MDRHPFEPVSFIVGLVFTLAAVIVLAEGRLIDEGRVLLPLGLIALGFAFLLRLAPGRQHDDGPEARR